MAKNFKSVSTQLPFEFDRQIAERVYRLISSHNIPVTIEATLADSSRLTLSDLDELTGLPNTNTRKIQSVTFEGRDYSRPEISPPRISIEFNEIYDTRTISYNLHGEDPIVEDIARKISEIATLAAPNYPWHVAITRKFKTKLEATPYGLYGLAGGLFFVLAPQKISLDQLNHSNLLITLKEVLVIPLIVAASGAALILWLSIVKRYYPTARFLIGEEIKRKAAAEKSKAAAYALMIGVIGSLIAATILR